MNPMATSFRESHLTEPPRSSAWVKAVCLSASIVGRAVRLTALAILVTLEPVVRIPLMLLSLGGFATCVLYRYVMHASHFPFGQMLFLSIAFAVLSLLYGLLVRGLAL
jgi:hypothetical protein